MSNKSFYFYIENAPFRDKSYQRTKVMIYGGSCLQPSKESLTHANLFVALDKRALQDRDLFVPLHRLYHINDGDIPEDVSRFKSFINDLLVMAKKDVVLHIGCIAGQGRTGLVLSALVQTAQPHILENLNISAIDYVRTLYSEKAIETIEQENFLIQHFGVKPPLKIS